ncbi:MAG: hypothetical protein ACK4NA_02120 [Alphaproteobacteria bacterium]
MTRFTVFGKSLDANEQQALRKFAEQAAGKGDEVSFAASIGEPDPSVDSEVVLVLGTASTCASADLANDLQLAANGARRIIWVWPEGVGECELPSVVRTYAYSIIVWNVGKLKSVAADDDARCFEASTGEALPKVETERNLCADVEAENPKAKTK